MPNLNMTTTFEQYLHSRQEAGEADQELANSIMGVYYHVDIDEKKPNYLDLALIDGVPRITYALEEKVGNLDHEERYTRRGLRVMARPGSVVKKLVGDQNGHAMDRFVQAIPSFLNPPDTSGYAMLTGDEVWNAFERDLFCPCNGTGEWSGGRTCMTGHNVRESVPSVAFLAEFASVAVWHHETCGKISARSLIWTDRGGQSAYDRVYGTTSGDHALRRILQTEGIPSLDRQDITLHLSAETFATYDATAWPKLDTMHHRCDSCFTLGSKVCPQVTGETDYWGPNRWNYGSKHTHPINAG